jgi:biotin carboxyl carrier protein
MENNLIASRNGTVKKVHVRQGQDVADDTVLVEYVA